MRPLTLALPKGRMFAQSVELLARAGVSVEVPRESRALRHVFEQPGGGRLVVLELRNSDVPAYVDLTAAETVEVATLTQSAVRVLTAAAAPAGFNLGMNQGDVAGAGIAAHLHQHVVPRWAGDANFLPVVARTKALPELLADTRDRLAAAWAASGEPGRASG